MESWERLGFDLTELILSYLPIETIARAAAVCKLWRSTISSSAFSVSANKKPPWFFLYGYNNVFLKSNQAFAFDPDSFRWLRLHFPPQARDAAFFAGSGGFLFAAASKFSFAPILDRNDGLVWRETTPLHISRCDPLVGVFDQQAPKMASPCDSHRRFIVVGGVRYVGGLVDIEDRLAVEIYDPNSDSWELCPPLPADFRPGGNSSQWLSSAIFRNKFYVFGVGSSFVSSFDLKNRSWSDVRTLRPPGVRFSFLIGCEGVLVLAGMCFTTATNTTSFNLWSVDENTMEFSEMGRMPEELLGELFEGGEGGGDYYYYDKFATLRCVGMGNHMFVFNEERYKNFPACVCQITPKITNGSWGSSLYESRWRRLPSLPSPVNQFHKVISFCSTVSIHNLFS